MDSTTLMRVSALKPPSHPLNFSLNFSPSYLMDIYQPALMLGKGAHFIDISMCVSTFISISSGSIFQPNQPNHSLVVWDTQTGVVISRSTGIWVVL